MLITHILNREYLVLATNKGLIFLDGSGKSPAKFTSLTDNISHLFSDRQGNLWITGSSGLYRMNSNSLSFEWTTINDPDPEWQHIYHIIPEIGNNSRYFLSTLKGWWQYDALSHQLSKFKLPSDPENLLGGINTWTANEKGYWFSSINGMGYYDKFNNRLDSWNSLAQMKSGQTSTGIIVADKSNKLWVSLHRSGILVFGQGGGNPTLLFADRNKPDNLIGKDIHDIQLIDDGSICFTADNRLFKVNASDYAYTSYSPEIKDERIDRNKTAPEKIFFSPGRSVFVSSSLQIYQFSQNRLAKVFPAEGYAEFIIGKIDCDSRGNIWALTSRGLLKTDTTFRHWVNISNKLGWEEDEEIEDFHLGPGGEVILAANGKFGILHDSLLSRSIAPPAVLISRVKHGDRVSYMVIGQPKPIKCSYKEAVEIELSSMNFTEDKETRILYMLEGWENKWNELSGQQLIRYEQLPPGDYTFLARQVNDEGAESEITSFKFSIPPPFYRSWWFIALILLAAAATHFSINHYRKRKALELERLRTRIAIDLHDDIGATLSSISIYSDALKRQLKDSQPMLVNVLDKMGESSREMVSGMSDIVWAINPDNDHGEKLISRMQNFATDVCAMKNIHLHFQEDERINSIVFPLEGRKNFYLVFKEAVNNAAKYSEASNLWISLQLQGGKLILQVRDDGRGFNENTIRRGNGLKNMKSRADEMKAEFQIISNPDEGTIILLNWNI
ncbi:MAG: hypothetical protein IPH88_17060 [Bacteroidales bacterium]|nr:hypothetical protein [Bacteroidales bacterium]